MLVVLEAHNAINCIVGKINVCSGISFSSKARLTSWRTLMSYFFLSRNSPYSRIFQSDAATALSANKYMF